MSSFFAPSGRLDGHYPDLPEFLYSSAEGIRRTNLEYIGSAPDWRPDRYRYYQLNPHKRPTFKRAAYKCAYHCRVNDGREAYQDRYHIVKSKTAPLKDQFGEENLLNDREDSEIEDRYVALRTHDEINNLLDRVLAFEASFFWSCPWTGLQRKCRADWLLELHTELGNTICDLKLVESIDMHSLKSAVARYGYHRQAATYVQGARACGFDVQQFYFVFQEESAPYAVQILDLGEEGLRIGEEQVKAQMKMLQFCMASEEWPAPSCEGIKQISLPKWCISGD